MIPFNQFIVSAAATAMFAACSSSERSAPTLKPQTDLTPMQATGALSITPSVLTVPDAALPDPVAAQAALADPNVMSMLRGMALTASSAAGVPSPTTVRVVAAADRQAAQSVLSGAIINDHWPIYVIVMTGGPFMANQAPRGAPTPHGNVLTLSVAAQTYRVTDIGYVDIAPDLNQIGPVVVNLLGQ